ncbi:hypothetical protein Aduo_006225 [Ancylostoma duodenale]
MKVFFFVLLLVAYMSTVASYDYKNLGSERIPRHANGIDGFIYDDYKYSRQGCQAGRWPWPQPQDNIPR